MFYLDEILNTFNDNFDVVAKKLLKMNKKSRRMSKQLFVLSIATAIIEFRVAYNDIRIDEIKKEMEKYDSSINKLEEDLRYAIDRANLRFEGVENLRETDNVRINKLEKKLKDSKKGA